MIGSAAHEPVHLVVRLLAPVAAGVHAAEGVGMTGTTPPEGWTIPPRPPGTAGFPASWQMPTTPADPERAARYDGPNLLDDDSSDLISTDWPALVSVGLLFLTILAIGFASGMLFERLL